MLRRGQLARSWRAAISAEEEAASPEHAEGRAREEAEAACTYCGLPLEDSAGGSRDNHMPVPVPCPRGGIVHISCMLDQAEGLATGYVDPRSCIVCCREGGRRPPHPAELARRLLVNESGGRWAALRNVMQFTELLQRDVPRPGTASYVATSVYSSFELMVNAHGRSPTSSFLLSMFSNALGLPQVAYLDFPRRREWEAAADRYSALFTAFGIRLLDNLLQLTNRRLYIGPHVQEYLVGLDADWEERLTRWTLGVQNALEEGFALPPFPVNAVPAPRGSEPALERDLSRRGSWGKKSQLQAPQRANRTQETVTPRQWNSQE